MTVSKIARLALFVVIGSILVARMSRLRPYKEEWARKATLRLLAILVLCTSLPIDLVLADVVGADIAIFITAVLVAPPALILLQRGRQRDLQD
jgi:hypothetical protein